jgi:hypothetical protein
VSLIPLREINLIPNLTLRENLCLPLIFIGIETSRRNEMIEQALTDYRLTTSAQKFFRYLTDEEQEKALQMRSSFSQRYPGYDRFKTILREKEGVDLGLNLLQYEFFTNIAHDLMVASSQVALEKFPMAVDALDTAIERLAFRVALGTFYTHPSLRVMDIALLVIRNYRDILKYREKIDVEILQMAKKRAISNLNALAVSFIEMRAQG